MRAQLRVADWVLDNLKFSLDFNFNEGQLDLFFTPPILNPHRLFYHLHVKALKTKAKKKRESYGSEDQIKFSTIECSNFHSRCVSLIKK